MNAFHQTEIESISIPSHLTEICESTFDECSKLIKVDIQIDSELQIIGKNAFSETMRKTISIPHKTIEIKENAFRLCKQLERVEISYNSELKIIGEHAFACTKIKSIFIPRHITFINADSFRSCSHLKYIEFDNNSETQTIEKSFCRSSIECFSCPLNLKNLHSYAFYWCKKIQIIELNKNIDINSLHFSKPKIIIMIPVK